MTQYNIPSLEELRANLDKTYNRNNNKSGGYKKDNQMYPFWNAPDDTTTVLRFLPDADETNPNFWRERHVINLPFKGIKDTEHFTDITVQVPCVTMFGKRCPIIEAIRPWWKDEAKKPIARIYNKKATYIFQGFVREGHLNEDESPENPIRRFMFTKPIFNVIFRGVYDTDMEATPIHFDRGTDFKIKKVPGSYGSNYDASTFARKESALTEDERAAIEKYGLNKLSEFQPNEPSQEQLGIIYQMFEDSLNGKPYDPTLYASYYLPSPFQKDVPNIPENIMDQLKNIGTMSAGQAAPQPTQPQAQQPVGESQAQPQPQAAAPWESQQQAAPTPQEQPSADIPSQEEALESLRARLRG